MAGDEHRTIQAGTNSVKVDLQPRRPIASTPTGAGEVADATGRVRVSAGAAQILSRPVEPNYPLLAKQMKVQGAVVLEALIGRLREEAAGAIAAIAMVDELCAPPIEDELDLGAFSHYR